MKYYSVFALFFSFYVEADSNIYETTGKAIEKYEAEHQSDSFKFTAMAASGDFNGDGVIDFVAVGGSAEHDHVSKVILFLGEPDGSFKFYKMSGQIGNPPNSTLEATVGYNTVSINISTSGDTSVYRFKNIKNKLVLAGLEQNDWEGKDDGCCFPTHGTSVNYFTHIVRKWVVENGVKKWQPDIYNADAVAIEFEKFNRE